MSTSRRKTIAQRCIECGLCVRECAFLQKYGTPKAIADCFNPADRARQTMVFECSLCELCAALCPVDLNPASMVLEMRRELTARRNGLYPQHSVLLRYEKRGTSPRYTYYALPAACDTVLFPGCTLSGTRSATVIQLYRHLAETIPSLGIVLDCCTKPSQSLGRQDHFRTMFGEMKNYLLEQGVGQVLVACASCHRTFKEHGKPLAVRSVYEILVENGLPKTEQASATVAIHDPCIVRFEESLQNAVRLLVAKKGLKIEEMPHHGAKTVCCGEGGAAGWFAPELAGNWNAIRHREAQHKPLLTYCAGCAEALKDSAVTGHVLDLLFEPAATLAGTVKVARAPWTYWQRLRLKKHFKRSVPAVITRERPAVPGTTAGKWSGKCCALSRWMRRLKRGSK